MWEPDDYTSNITIPSVLLDYNKSKLLMEHLGVTNWNATYPGNTGYPIPADMNWTIGTIEWGLPHYDDRVEWELWTSGNDADSIAFKQNFKNTSLTLSAANDTVFTPHVYVLNGSHWGCTTPDLLCRKQCTNSGRYCAVDPEYDMASGLDGMDVVQENLRQLCLWNYTDTNNLGETFWWDYSVLWNTYCFNGTINTKTFTENCSFTQLQTVDPSLKLLQAVKNCITESGGYDYNGGINTLLDYETWLREDSSVYALPMVVVNQFLIHGDISCDVITTESCQVLDAICAGFINGTQPPICHATPSPTPVTCSSNRKDCAGICYGSHRNDSCDQCLLISSPLWNYCVGCDGIPYSNKTTDCANVCGGNMKTNPCGYCILSNSTNFTSYGTDCNGTCNGNAVYDRCGKCLLETDSSFDSCVGCDDVVNSGKINNPCGYCLLKNDTSFNTYGKDCNGTCNGNAVYDRCGQCLLETDSSFDSCVGCDGIVNSGKSTNPCGYCISSSLTNFETIGQDCRGICDSSNSYQTDECNNCTKIGGEYWNSCFGCDGVPFSNATWICGICAYQGTDTYNHACDNFKNVTVSSNNSNSFDPITAIIIIIAVVLLVVIIAGVIIYRLWKRQKDVDASFNKILQNYQVMEDTNVKSKTKSSKEYKTVEQVPDDEDLNNL